ncbi:hypothetical protein GIW63_16310, partial [Pseudomonas syringae]|nr:hypothetical protein [Pseudomonas syringae]
YISVTKPSRASSLPQDQRCCRTSTWLENTPDLRSDPQGLKTPRTCGSELAHEEAGAVAENLYIRDYAFASKLPQRLVDNGERSALPR